MVRFEKDRFIIEIEEKFNPIEAWKETFDEMLDLLGAENLEDKVNRYRYIGLLREMLPGDELIKEMQNLLYDKNAFYENKIAKCGAAVDQLCKKSNN